jgi:hypothetical protein
MLVKANESNLINHEKSKAYGVNGNRDEMLRSRGLNRVFSNGK